MGREVQILDNGFRDIGEYSIIWDASNFASGIYYINLIAGNLVETQKLMLIK